MKVTPWRAQVIAGEEKARAERMEREMRNAVERLKLKQLKAEKRVMKMLRGIDTGELGKPGLLAEEVADMIYEKRTVTKGALTGEPNITKGDSDKRTPTSQED